MADSLIAIGTVAGIFLVGIILYYVITLLFTKKEEMDVIVKGVLSGNEDGSRYDQTASTMKRIAGATEYSFSFWVYVDTFDGKDHVILKRDDAGMLNPDVTLSKEANTMVFKMSNSGGEVLKCEVPMVPLQRWNCFTVNVLSNSINVYMNGRLYRSCTLYRNDGIAASGLPFSNVDAGLRVKPGTAFPGKIATVFFRNRTMNSSDIMSVYRAGPNAGSTGLLYQLFGIKEIRVVFEDTV